MQDKKVASVYFKFLFYKNIWFNIWEIELIIVLKQDLHNWGIKTDQFLKCMFAHTCKKKLSVHLLTKFSNWYLTHPQSPYRDHSKIERNIFTHFLYSMSI